ncbi:VOC family protein [Brachybacterium sp. AOP43-C2-M15]|uniref:VOC family protein n=1 Tax=Brachybacterium sp. AOP43-C2-M15 TaxID=3457661 RepID=UPI0040347834
MPTYPVLSCTAIDARNPRALAEFYSALLGLHCRPGDAPPEPPAADDTDWIVLLDGEDRRVLAVQGKPDLRPSTWPSEEIPMQLHMDFRVPDAAELEMQRERAEKLGARMLMGRSSDPDEPLYVMGDPEGHPFCLLVG